MKKRIVFLDGIRLYLRPVTESDVLFLVRWFNNPEVTRFLNRRFPMTESGERKWIAHNAEQRHEIVLIIVLKGKRVKDDRPIGTMGIHKLEWENGVAVTGAAIGEKDCWGKGYGTEAKELFLEFLFNTLNLRKIYSHVLATNPRSRAYSEKCGYQLEATLKERHFREGRYVDEHILSVTADAWRKRRLTKR